MKKRLLCLFVIFFLIPSIVLPTFALGGYFVVKGLDGYHSAMCENLTGYNIDQVKWYETLEKVKRTGLSPAQCCKDIASDYVDDEASKWISKNKKIKNIFEVERMWGILDGYDIGVEEGYDSGFSEGSAIGYDDGYQKGFGEATEELTVTINTLHWYLCAGIILFTIAIGSLWSYYHYRHNKVLQELDNDRKELDEHISTTKKHLAQEQQNMNNWKQTVIRDVSATEKDALKNINSQRSLFQRIIKETKQNNPFLATQIADAQYYLDMGIFNQLVHKQRPAMKAAEEVKKIAGEKRQLMQENRQLRYQLDYYEGLFPWLEQFKEIPSDEAVAYVSGSYGTEYDAVKKWLSPEEYEKLGNAEKFQLALDRWKNRKKEDWDVGIEYERYIGYRLECEGYKVSYPGAILGLKDMGRDLLASKDGVTLVIQCKRWAKEKTIHEKHIFQLYGSTAVLSAEHPGTHYKAVFITTAVLSDTAKKCANYCGISVVENCPMGDYPLIKCNKNKDGEKIYHLPFDQQYDKIVISKNKQSCYAWTTREAESLGFRRAYRWHPNKS